ncbi:MAG: acetylornithine transaminase [Bacteroidota bacterium]
MDPGSDRLFVDTYERLPLDIREGKGVHLIDTRGRTYLDLFSGLAVNALGYGDPGITAAVNHQLSRYTHLSNYFRQDSQIALARALRDSTGFDRVFFTNSGTEAVEGALKMARRLGGASGRSTIIGFSGSFHGRTLGALSVTGREQHRAGFGPLLPGTLILPFNDPAALREAAQGRPVAVILEYIQGEGGIRPVTGEFAAELHRLHREAGFLLIADEIQSGLGRTGRFFAYHHWGARPDIVVSAKALGGGFPLGAILCTEEASGGLPRGSHGSTFGGNPVACAAGCEILRRLTEGGLADHARRMGDHLREGLEGLRRRHPQLVTDVRGKGLMVGLETAVPARSFSGAMLEAGFLLNHTAGNVLRFLPPLIIAEADLDSAIRALEATFLAFLRRNKADEGLFQQGE